MSTGFLILGEEHQGVFADVQRFFSVLHPHVVHVPDTEVHLLTRHLQLLLFIAQMERLRTITNVLESERMDDVLCDLGVPQTKQRTQAIVHHLTRCFGCCAGCTFGETEFDRSNLEDRADTAHVIHTTLHAALVSVRTTWIHGGVFELLPAPHRKTLGSLDLFLPPRLEHVQIFLHDGVIHHLQDPTVAFALVLFAVCLVCGRIKHRREDQGFHTRKPVASEIHVGLRVFHQVQQLVAFPATRCGLLAVDPLLKRHIVRVFESAQLAVKIHTGAHRTAIDPMQLKDLIGRRGYFFAELHLLLVERIKRTTHLDTASVENQNVGNHGADHVSPRPRAAWVLEEWAHFGGMGFGFTGQVLEREIEAIAYLLGSHILRISRHFDQVTHHLLRQKDRLKAVQYIDAIRKSAHRLHQLPQGVDLFLVVRKVGFNIEGCGCDFTLADIHSSANQRVVAYKEAQRLGGIAKELTRPLSARFNDLVTGKMCGAIRL